MKEFELQVTTPNLPPLVSPTPQPEASSIKNGLNGSMKFPLNSYNDQGEAIDLFLDKFEKWLNCMDSRDQVEYKTGTRFERCCL